MPLPLIYMTMPNLRAKKVGEHGPPDPLWTPGGTPIYPSINPSINPSVDLRSQLSFLLLAVQKKKKIRVRFSLLQMTKGWATDLEMRLYFVPLFPRKCSSFKHRREWQRWMPSMKITSIKRIRKGTRARTVLITPLYWTQVLPLIQAFTTPSADQSDLYSTYYITFLPIILCTLLQVNMMHCTS